MANWATDTELFDLARNVLYVAVVGDVMDELGHHDQFLPAGIKPVSKGAVVIGRAMPVLEADVPFDTYESTRSLAVSKPFGLMLDALDDLQPDEVYICTGSSPNYALWGELMSTRASYLGAAGAVVDGYNRDMRAIQNHAFPVFSRAATRRIRNSAARSSTTACPSEFATFMCGPETSSSETWMASASCPKRSKPRCSKWRWKRSPAKTPCAPRSRQAWVRSTHSKNTT